LIVIARNHIGAAADHRGERLGAALKVDEFDIQSGVLVFAELFGKHRRQITQASGPADRDRDLRRRHAGCQRKRAERDGRAGNEYRDHGTSDCPVLTADCQTQG